MIIAVLNDLLCDLDVKLFRQIDVKSFPCFLMTYFSPLLGVTLSLYYTFQTHPTSDENKSPTTKTHLSRCFLHM